MVSAPPATTSCDRFRRQHEELRILGSEIASRLSRKTIAEEATEVRRLVAQFGGKLMVHASMENEALYPRLLSHSDAAVRARATALFEEVGTYGEFQAYAARWPTVGAIQENGGEFVKQTRELLARLALRMMRENEELYPLVDACGG